MTLQMAKANDFWCRYAMHDTAATFILLKHHQQGNLLSRGIFRTRNISFKASLIISDRKKNKNDFNVFFPTELRVKTKKKHSKKIFHEKVIFFCGLMITPKKKHRHKILYYFS